MKVSEHIWYRIILAAMLFIGGIAYLIDKIRQYNYETRKQIYK